MTSVRNYNLNTKNKRHFIIGKTISQNIPMFSNIEKIHQERTRNTVKCKCSHSVIFPANTDKRICWWCGRIVFNTTQDHFKYKLRKLKEGE